MKTIIHQAFSLALLLCISLLLSCKKEVRPVLARPASLSGEKNGPVSVNRWDPSPGEYYRIRNSSSNLVLQVKSYNEEAVIQGTWNGDAAQLWTIAPIWNNGGSYVITNGFSGKVLTGLKGPNGPISFVIQDNNAWSIHPLLQAWWIQDRYNGRFVLKPGFQYYALTSPSNSPGNEVTIYSYHLNSENQEWYIELPPS
ncbi:RICIN domain-containing protein [Chitinophaga pendula]|uniref:RICIN domain-containing protein n=1 Tax=Chitinophaga TaxID=79328 RepID=UPI000BAEAB6B|nr:MULTISPECIES: RICIN domain-containing protein [Chitinophaga]ASZ10921.1 hypothetical protein CK934_08000 [Chitinophaga sp. MD30]UCJ06091.1 RICIN domain-containing protein [Chitinophaga pendula]